MGRKKGTPRRISPPTLEEPNPAPKPTTNSDLSDEEIQDYVEMMIILKKMFKVESVADMANLRKEFFALKREKVEVNGRLEKLKTEIAEKGQETIDNCDRNVSEAQISMILTAKLKSIERELGRSSKDIDKKTKIGEKARKKKKDGEKARKKKNDGEKARKKKKDSEKANDDEKAKVDQRQQDLINVIKRFESLKMAVTQTMEIPEKP